MFKISMLLALTLSFSSFAYAESSNGRSEQLNCHHFYPYPNTADDASSCANPSENMNQEANQDLQASPSQCTEELARQLRNCDNDATCTALAYTAYGLCMGGL